MPAEHAGCCRSLPFFGIEGPLDANLTLLDNLHSL